MGSQRIGHNFTAEQQPPHVRDHRSNKHALSTQHIIRVKTSVIDNTIDTERGTLSRLMGLCRSGKDFFM